MALIIFTQNETASYKSDKTAGRHWMVVDGNAAIGMDSKIINVPFSVKGFQVEITGQSVTDLQSLVNDLNQDGISTIEGTRTFLSSRGLTDVIFKDPSGTQL